jgi:hypothetical protein
LSPKFKKLFKNNISGIDRSGQKTLITSIPCSKNTYGLRALFIPAGNYLLLAPAYATLFTHYFELMNIFSGFIPP